jgi:hypothetical protein
MLPPSSTQMKGEDVSETSVPIYQTTRRHIEEGVSKKQREISTEDRWQGDRHGVANPYLVKVFILASTAL